MPAFAGVTPEFAALDDFFTRSDVGTADRYHPLRGRHRRVTVAWFNRNHGKVSQRRLP